MNALTRLERIDNLFPEMMRRWARPLQMLDDVDVPSDIRVSIDGNYISTAADIKKELEEKHGSVSRGFTLGSEVDDKTAVAKLEDGVLRLTLPKQQGSSSRVLKIEQAAA